MSGMMSALSEDTTDPEPDPETSRRVEASRVQARREGGPQGSRRGSLRSSASLRSQRSRGRDRPGGQSNRVEEDLCQVPLDQGRGCHS